MSASVNLDSSINQTTFLQRVLENSLIAGDLSRAALEQGDNERLPRCARQSIITKAHLGVCNLVLLISDLENRTAGVTPFLSAGLDFLASGAFVPA